ncbi:MAG TPA: HisA/HisF-related TIM barrel protein, partial [Gammaproteobacteria bacterium]
MLLIPAIDIKDGKCVRLRQGRMDAETVYSDNPLEVAERWVNAGARRLHVVDLNGAVTGKPGNADIIHAIVEAHPQIPVQVGGGIRDEDTIQTYLDAGVSFVIIGTRAVTTPHFVADVCLEFPSHIIVGLDARDGKLATEGWSKLSHHDAVDMARRFEDEG